MQGSALKHIRIEGLHGHQVLEARLVPGLNIIYGRNGSGKTTFLHVIANLVERDLERFCNLNFESIKVKTFNGDTVELISQPSSETARNSVAVTVNNSRLGTIGPNEGTPDEIDAVLGKVLGGRPVYLPAFRSILEAISDNRARQTAVTAEREIEIRRIADAEQRHLMRVLRSDKEARAAYNLRESAMGVAYKTTLCRDWFGRFVPIVRFPALMEVADQLFEEFRQAQVEVAATDRQAFSAAFVKVLKVVMGNDEDPQKGDSNKLLANIRTSLEKLQQTKEVSTVYDEIARVIQKATLAEGEREVAAKVLKVYDTSLRERVHAEKSAFQRIRTFEDSVNQFLTGKKLQVDSFMDDEPILRRRQVRSKMINLQNGRRENLSVLSSGERHVLTLLFSATHMSSTEGILLIDEPELSLHIDWQRIILGEIMKQAGQRQIIACTHAPEVTAEHRSSMIKLKMVSAAHHREDIFQIDFDE